MTSGCGSQHTAPIRHPGESQDPEPQTARLRPWILGRAQDDGKYGGHHTTPVVILTKVRIQSHERHRVRLWILDQVQDDGRYFAGPISFCAKYVIWSACIRAPCSMSASPECPPAVSS